MIAREALDAIRAGRPGVHLVLADGRPVEAVELLVIGDELFVRTRFFCGDPGPTVRARAVRALEREYEEVGDG